MSNIVKVKSGGKEYDLNLQVTSATIEALRQTIKELSTEVYLSERVGLEQAAMGLLDMLEKELSLPIVKEPVISTEDNPKMKFRIGDELFDHREGRGDHFYNVEGYIGDNYYGFGGTKYNGNSFYRCESSKSLIESCYALVTEK